MLGGGEEVVRAICPLHNPVTWYKITHAGEQVAQWDSKTMHLPLF